MPTLNWIGKDAVVKHHHQVPFHLLRDVPDLASGDPGAGNLIVRGDNLVALKALLPHYAGQVKCACIDPPYNTGNEGWAYNDNVNSPVIREWLGKVVGKEGETLDRHDRWLCMMYPRLALIREFLSDDGSIFVTLDDNEIGNLRLLMDEIFGAQNFVANLVWEKADSPRNSARQFSEDHDHILVYSRRPSWQPNKLPRTEASNAIYQNPDNDTRGPWIPGDPYANKPYSKGLYTIKGPTGREFSPPAGRFWRVSEEKLRELDEDGRVWWGPTGAARPSIKRYLSEVSDLVPRTLWNKQDVGSNRTSTFYGERSGFATWIRRVDSLHGNTVGDQITWLYKLETSSGDFLKWGITGNLAKRYPAEFLEGKRLLPIRQGSRSEIAEIERWLTESYPGPLNFEPWAGSKNLFWQNIRR